VSEGLSVRAIPVAALAVVAILVFPARAIAQDAGQIEVRDSAFQNLATLPSVGRPKAPSVSISLDATSEEKIGSVAIVVAPESRDDLTLSVSVSGPLDQDTKTAEPLRLDGLSNAAKAEGGLHWFVWSGKPDLEAGRRICQRNVNRPDCDDDEIKDREERVLFLRSQAADTDPITVDVEGSYSRNTFKFLDPATFASGSEGHSSGSFSLALGRFSPRAGYMWGGYEFAHSWEAAGSPRQICTPLAGGATECRTATVGAPDESSKHLMQLGWRRFVLRGRAALDPTFEWDPANSVAAFSLPLYGFTKKNEGLAGGVKVGWRSDTDDITAVIFVGNVLSIIR
jgi:hypothetical protein